MNTTSPPTVSAMCTAAIAVAIAACATTTTPPTARCPVCRTTTTTTTMSAASATMSRVVAASPVSAASRLSPLANILDVPAIRFPSKDLIRFVAQDFRWTTTALRKHTRAVGVGIAQLNVSKEFGGVLMMLPNNAERLTMQLAAGLCGSKAGAFNSGSPVTADALTAAAKTSGARIVVVGNTMKDVATARKGLSLPGPMEADSLGRAIDNNNLPALRFAMHTSKSRENWLVRFRDIQCYFPIPDHLETPRPISEVVLEMFDPTTGAKTKEYSLPQLTEKAHKIVTSLKLTPDDKLLLSSGSSAYAVYVACLASCESCAQLIMPASSPVQKDEANTLMEMEKITAVIGEEPYSHARFHRIEA